MKYAWCKVCASPRLVIITKGGQQAIRTHLSPFTSKGERVKVGQRLKNAMCDGSRVVVDDGSVKKV